MMFVKDLWSSFQSSTRSWSVEVKLPSPADPWSHSDCTSSPSSDYYLGCGEVPNRSDHTGVGEELPPSSLVGGPRITVEELGKGTFLKTLAIRWGYAGHMPIIRQSYASGMLTTLPNRQAYAKMYIYVADTSDIRY